MEELNICVTNIKHKYMQLPADTAVRLLDQIPWTNAEIIWPVLQRRILAVQLLKGKDCSREGRLEQGLLWVVIRLHGHIKSMNPMKDVEPYQHTPVCPLTEELFHRRHAIDMTAATVYIHEFRRCLTISSVPLHEAFSDSSLVRTNMRI